MIRFRPLLVVVAAVVVAAAGFPGAAHAAPPTVAPLPIMFEENVGQTDPSARFISRVPGSTIFLSPAEATLVLSRADAAPRSRLRPRPTADTTPTSDVVRLRFLGASATAEAVGLDPLPTKRHLLIGADPSRWRRNVPTHARVRFAEVYPGIDVVYYGRDGHLEYDVVVAPGANPGVVRLAIDGGDATIADDGDLVVTTGARRVVMRTPVAYQAVDGVERRIASRYARQDDGTITFALGDYDRSKPLVIDPVVVYSTYLGGSLGDTATGIAVDSAGNAYVTGLTAVDFPSGSGGLRTATTGIFVAKLSADGRTLVYSAVIGGGFGSEWVSGIAVDAAGSAYVAGSYVRRLDDDAGFPLVRPLQGYVGGCAQGEGDALVFKLSADGSELLFSTYLHGRCHDEATGVAVDPAGNIYVAGYNRGGAVIAPQGPQYAPGGFNGLEHAFVVKIRADYSGTVYSTVLAGSRARDGGARNDYAWGIAVDTEGNAYVAGETGNFDFPTVNAFASTPGGEPSEPQYIDAFVTKITPDGSSLVYSTFLGGSFADAAYAIAVDASGNAYVTGFTESFDFPTTSGALQSLFNGWDAFVTKLSAAGASVYSTYLGGLGVNTGWGIGVDGAGSAAVVLSTTAPDFPLQAPLQGFFVGPSEIAVARLNADASALTFSTYFGAGTAGAWPAAIAVTGSGDIYIAGTTSSALFPVLNALQPDHGGDLLSPYWEYQRDAFVTRMVPGRTASAARTVTTSNIAASFAAPAAGSTVSGAVSIDMVASGATGSSTTFTLSIDGTTVSTQTVSGTTASYPWNTNAVANGTHSMTVTVSSGGQTATRTQSVTVSNVTASFTVSFQYPPAGATVSGVKSVGLSTTAPWGVSKTWTLSVGGTVISRQTTTGTTLWIRWDTTTTANEPQTLTATVEMSGETATASRAVNVEN